MRLILDRKFKNKLKGRFGKYDFKVGILNDGPHKDAQPKTKGLSSYAGGPIRKKTRTSDMSISQVSEANRQHLGVNFYSQPFKDKTADVVKFTREFFRLAFGKSEKKRAENLLQAVVRNPILKGEYGSNGRMAMRAKGFNRKMIDTAQLFKAIKAMCTVRGGKDV